MDRKLLSKILTVMKNYLKENKSIGNLKLASLLALGHQLEAIFYYLGHELGTILNVPQINDIKKIPEELKRIISEHNIGESTITESSDEIIQIKLSGHSSVKDLIGLDIENPVNFSSFEAGMLAGIVEKMSNVHCFAQELSCNLQKGNDYCEFMIVLQSD